MLLYQLKIVVPEKKFDEFIDSLRFLSNEIREEEGCLDFSLYSDLEKQNAYSVLGKWKTRQAMESHFKREKFPVLMGAARVLGEDFEMSIGETLEKGSYPFAQEKISLHSGKGKIQKIK
jgi:quinol monooxygenase YgiN